MARNSPKAICRIITQKLALQTPDPQIQVRRVSVIGSIGSQGVISIERPTRILSTILVRAGGVTISPEIAQVTVLRGKERGKI